MSFIAEAFLQGVVVGAFVAGAVVGFMVVYMLGAWVLGALDAAPRGDPQRPNGW